ncbi:unnamed protein product [Linum trigynum]|uniref:Uncharacterized protein n=1 Tax=Linum trigynum TaxID=586398 RepID=A0AAV2D834_9ROSI
MYLRRRPRPPSRCQEPPDHGNEVRPEPWALPRRRSWDEEIRFKSRDRHVAAVWVCEGSRYSFWRQRSLGSLL